MKRFRDFITEEVGKEDLRKIYSWLNKNSWDGVNMEKTPNLTVRGNKGKYRVQALIAANPDDLDKLAIKYDIFKGRKNIDSGFVKSVDEFTKKLDKL